ncbi:DUF2791 family P-loop domain-containing protein [Kribbella sp. NBC_01245]|uniref:ATP-binding protein n=1 Tax=Kribbella sp. NBC_01245 TaxID=2903578 RepID=UPI002E2D7B71|nr:BREX system ATP-binding domain-containing protein [Kribbella sp. NBC_01245]
MPTGMGGAAGAGLFGRDAELARLADLLSQAGSGGVAAAVIRGEVGSGKTALLRVVADRARADGWTCLAVSGIESEAVLSGAGLLAALTPLRRDLDSVPAFQADVLAAALGWGPAPGSGDRFLVGASTLSLLAAAAARAPLLLAVDDVQWVDAQSMEALAFAARRLGHDRFVLLVTHRDGTPLPVPLAGFDVVAVAGLTREAARDLLGSGFSASVVERLVSETPGRRRSWSSKAASAPSGTRSCGRPRGPGRPWPSGSPRTTHSRPSRSTRRPGHGIAPRRLLATTTPWPRNSHASPTWTGRGAGSRPRPAPSNGRPGSPRTQADGPTGWQWRPRTRTSPAMPIGYGAWRLR